MNKRGTEPCIFSYTIDILIKKSWIFNNKNRNFFGPQYELLYKFLNRNHTVTTLLIIADVLSIRLCKLQKGSGMR